MVIAVVFARRLQQGSPITAAEGRDRRLVVDWGALLEVVLDSLLAGIGVTAIFAVAILGATRAVDLRHDGQLRPRPCLRRADAVALAAVAAAVVFGIVVMTQK